MDPRDTLHALFQAALDAAGPEGRFGDLPPPPVQGTGGRVIVLAAGKAAARMAAAFEDAWEAHAGALPQGLAVTRYGHAAPTRAVEVVEAAHPVPDAEGEAGARRMLELARAAGPDDLVCVLISGGASALLAAPAEGVTLADKAEVGRALLRSGAPIGEMNRVRQALSAVKGGRLAAAAAPARVVAWAISDVPGDDPAVIGSGPTVPLPPGEAPEAILARRGVDLPPRLLDAMARNPAPALAEAEVRMLATPQMALEAAARAAEARGIAPLILSDRLEGEAREVGTALSGIALQAAVHGQPLPRPCVLLSGGETTVTVRGKGRGGRNAEFLLALAVALGPEAARHGIWALAADTDGIDGIETNAGAILTPDAGARAEAQGLNLRARLDDNDGFGAFEALGDLVVTGPTLTNVNDFRAILLP
ncbi:MAG: glycerate kinase [Pseudomonadota bacterium]